MYSLVVPSVQTQCNLPFPGLTGCHPSFCFRLVLTLSVNTYVPLLVKVYNFDPPFYNTLAMKQGIFPRQQNVNFEGVGGYDRNEMTFNFAPTRKDVF